MISLKVVLVAGLPSEEKCFKEVRLDFMVNISSNIVYCSLLLLFVTKGLLCVVCGCSCPVPIIRGGA